MARRVFSTFQCELPASVFVDIRFPEIPSEALEPPRWRLRWKARFHGDEATHVKELRAIAAGLNNMCCRLAINGEELLILADRMCRALSIGKGRACDPRFSVLLRRLSAPLLASGARLSVRWAPSDFNVADPPSRAFEADAKGVSVRLRHLLLPHCRAVVAPSHLRRKCGGHAAGWCSRHRAP
jgi:hypothetical protein